jgi:hypothetical protein
MPSIALYPYPATARLSRPRFVQAGDPIVCLVNHGPTACPRVRFNGTTVEHRFPRRINAVAWDRETKSDFRNAQPLQSPSLNARGTALCCTEQLSSQAG